MKKTFSWYFPLSDAEVDEVWKNGLFTVDANVLLDLYRYNVATRDKLLEIIESFKDRAWLTHQTATEFFRNKNNVIAKAQDKFRQFTELSDLNKDINNFENELNGSHIFSKDFVEQTISKLKNTLIETQKAIKNESIPDYLQDDSILEKIALVFEGKIGAPYSQEEKEKQETIAKERFEKLIPPGFKDEEKDSEEKFGDYYFWDQVLKKSKEAGKDVILVTSERKEDWWEKIHNKTIGPRKELLEEAAKISGKNILIYQTEFFLELVAKKLKINVSPETVEEVKAVREDDDSCSCVNLLEHNVSTSSDVENSGTIKFLLKRTKFRFTCSGHFAPHLSMVPKLDVKLIQGPANLPKYSIHSGTGTQFDFNIHVKSWDFGIPLPIGEYTFQYYAYCCDKQPDLSHESSSQI